MENIQNQIGSNPRNVITVPITISNSTTIYVDNGNIVIINCQFICNKCDYVSDVAKDMLLDVLVITETCLIGNVSG